MNTIQLFSRKKMSREKISMVTCYDYTFARLINDTDIDCILVGDSAAMIMHGEKTTLPATMEMMCAHTRAVSLGAPKKFVIADMPFLSYRKDITTTMSNVQMLMQHGANAIKLEGGADNTAVIQHLVNSGVPVMGHLGLTPQSVHQLGGFRVQGKSDNQAEKIMQDALALQSAGCFSLVLECIPSSLSHDVTKALSIPTIGIGAGFQTDGQVLVLHDLLGLQEDLQPKFLKTYLNGTTLIKNALNSYHKEVVTSAFPSDEHCY